jgi:hypothetical protein
MLTELFQLLTQCDTLYADILTAASLSNLANKSFRTRTSSWALHWLAKAANKTFTVSDEIVFTSLL